MTPLRQRMIREMQLRQFSKRTIESYVDAVLGLAKREDVPLPPTPTPPEQEPPQS